VLSYYGHANVRMLNGGWQRWVEEGRPVSIRLSEPTPGDFTPRPNEAMRVRLDEMKRRHGDADVQVVNVLSPEWFEGTENPFESTHIGHIPGSTNVPIEQFLADGDVPTLRSSDEIARVLADAGLDRDKETIVHCYAGVRTTMGVFAMSLLGWDRVRAYDASMAEWANRDDTPLVTGPAG
jgi:thiosulfate/3-mercaptopyruvate sulfurtransferase